MNETTKEVTSSIPQSSSKVREAIKDLNELEERVRKVISQLPL